MKTYKGLFVFDYLEHKPLWLAALKGDKSFYVVRGSFVASIGVAGDFAVYHEDEASSRHTIDNGLKVPQAVGEWAFPEIAAVRKWRA